VGRLIDHYLRHLLVTSRITEGENRNVLVTIMVIIVCFSWALDSHIISLINLFGCCTITAR